MIRTVAAAPAVPAAPPAIARPDPDLRQAPGAGVGVGLGVIGATGYAGAELIRLLAGHPHARLRDPDEYPRRYGMDHPDPDLLAGAVYGLTEWCGDDLAPARLVANPGCYATACLIALLPAVRARIHAGGPIHVHAMSGVSGAGRAASLTTHFVECGDDATPYKVGEQHAHLGEIGQAVGAGASGPILLNPHLVPMSRGILANVAIPLARAMDEEEARALYRSCYDGAPFVRVLDAGALPHTRDVRGANRCDLAVRTAAGGAVLMVFSALDNLVKGAAGQAIQNWNRMQGWPDTTGLPIDGWGGA